MAVATPTIRALIVEDNRTQSIRLRRALAAAGLDVATTGDGREALDALAAAEYDVVLTDVVMPRMGGYELCRRIKADPHLAGTPVILLTSLGEPTAVIRGLEAGADGFVNKPYEDDHLLARIRGALAARDRRGARADGPAEVLFMGETFRIDAGRHRILDFLAATFEDFVHASRREHAAALELAGPPRPGGRGASPDREESLLREREALLHAGRFLQSTLACGTASRVAILDEAGRVLAVNAAWGREGALGRCPRRAARSG